MSTPNVNSRIVHPPPVASGSPGAEATQQLDPVVEPTGGHPLGGPLAPPGGPHPHADGRTGPLLPGQGVPVGTLVSDVQEVLPLVESSGILHKINKGPVATILTALIVAVVLIGGLIITITNPATLSFHAFVDTLTGLAIATGALGVGRGIAASS